MNKITVNGREWEWEYHINQVPWSCLRYRREVLNGVYEDVFIKNEGALSVMTGMSAVEDNQPIAAGVDWDDLQALVAHAQSILGGKK